MRTTLNIEITSKDTYPVIYEEGDNEEEYTKEQKKGLPSLRKNYALLLHEDLVEDLKEYLSGFEEYFLDNCDDTIEGLDTFEDYNINIKIRKAKGL